MRKIGWKKISQLKYPIARKRHVVVVVCASPKLLVFQLVMLFEPEYTTFIIW